MGTTDEDHHYTSLMEQHRSRPYRIILNSAKALKYNKSLICPFTASSKNFHFKNELLGNCTILS